MILSSCRYKKSRQFALDGSICIFINGGSSSEIPENWFPQLELFDITPFIWKAPYRNKSFLEQKYLVEGLSISQIAAEIFSSKNAVQRNLVAFGIPLRVKSNPHGRPSQPKYGQRLVQGNAKPHLAERRTIELVQKLRSEGHSLREIAALLNEQGVPTKNRGKRWLAETVSRVIRTA